MDRKRAQRIVRSFPAIAGLSVGMHGDGIQVILDGNARYFIREPCFWPYVFRSAGTAAEEISRLEMRLTA
jgi:hypothetical protein